MFIQDTPISLRKPLVCLGPIDRNGTKYTLTNGAKSLEKYIVFGLFSMTNKPLKDIHWHGDSLDVIRKFPRTVRIDIGSEL